MSAARLISRQGWQMGPCAAERPRWEAQPSAPLAAVSQARSRAAALLVARAEAASSAGTAPRRVPKEARQLGQELWRRLQPHRAALSPALQAALDQAQAALQLGEQSQRPQARPKNMAQGAGQLGWQVLQQRQQEGPRPASSSGDGGVAVSSVDLNALEETLQTQPAASMALSDIAEVLQLLGALRLMPRHEWLCGARDTLRAAVMEAEAQVAEARTEGGQPGAGVRAVAEGAEVMLRQADLSALLEAESVAAVGAEGPQGGALACEQAVHGPAGAAVASEASPPASPEPETAASTSATAKAGASSEPAGGILGAAAHESAAAQPQHQEEPLWEEPAPEEPVAALRRLQALMQAARRAAGGAAGPVLTGCLADDGDDAAAALNDLQQLLEREAAAALLLPAQPQPQLQVREQEVAATAHKAVRAPALTPLRLACMLDAARALQPQLSAALLAPAARLMVSLVRGSAEDEPGAAGTGPAQEHVAALLSACVAARYVPPVHLLDKLAALAFAAQQPSPQQRRTGAYQGAAAGAASATSAAPSSGTASSASATASPAGLTTAQKLKALDVLVAARVRPHPAQLAALLDVGMTLTATGSSSGSRLAGLSGRQLTRLLWLCVAFRALPSWRFVGEWLQAAAVVLRQAADATPAPPSHTTTSATTSDGGAAGDRSGSGSESTGGVSPCCLVRMGWCLSQMGLRPEPAWQAEYHAALLPVLPALDLEALSLAATSVLALRSRPGAEWLEGWMRAALGRMEAPGVAAAELDGASAARLVHFAAAAEAPVTRDWMQLGPGTVVETLVRAAHEQRERFSELELTWLLETLEQSYSGYRLPPAAAANLAAAALGLGVGARHVTQRFLDSAVLAKQQVQERCGGYHRVLYAITDDLGPANSTKAIAVAADLKALRATLGEDGVIALGPQDFSTTFGFEWNKFPIPGRFTWNHCDAPELVWFDLFSRDLDPAIKHVWAAEYDVAWTGDIAGVFGTFPERPDFICSHDFKSGGTNIGSGWSNYHLRTWLQGTEVKQCFIMLARYSLRYMRVFWEETRMGHLQFCEISGAAICSKHHTWCQIHSFDQHSDVVGRDSKGGSLFHFSSHIAEEEWRRQVAAFGAAQATSTLNGSSAAAGAAPSVCQSVTSTAECNGASAIVVAAYVRVELGAHHGAHSWQPVATAVEVAFLQKTHKVTQRFLDSAVLAKQQVQERCGGYHRVLYSVHEDVRNASSPKARAVASDLRRLRAALGEDGVITFGIHDFSTTFNFDWGKSPLRGRFSWNHCDAPELVWFDLFSRDLDPAIKHVWTAEYDVAWTGDIAGVFGTFPERPDFVCSTNHKKGMSVKPGWANHKLRTWLQDNEVKQCFIMLARYSLRYMRVFWELVPDPHVQLKQ
eukprot:XP_001697068.1 predicted protein [Chlamydomonas reinhardtii]